LRIGMTAADIRLRPARPTGAGMRFMGYTVYDGLLNGSFVGRQAIRAGAGPGAAWKVDDSDRSGVHLA
jgi:hypothetical protein